MLQGFSMKRLFMDRSGRGIGKPRLRSALNSFAATNNFSNADMVVEINNSCEAGARPRMCA
jgi:hypothetical protein